MKFACFKVLRVRKNDLATSKKFRKALTTPPDWKSFPRSENKHEEVSEGICFRDFLLAFDRRRGFRAANRHTTADVECSSSGTDHQHGHAALWHRHGGLQSNGRRNRGPGSVYLQHFRRDTPGPIDGQCRLGCPPGNTSSPRVKSLHI